MLKKMCSKENLCKQFSLLVCIQPIIDIYRIFVGNRIEIFGISLVELVNILFIGFLAIMFILNQRKWKSFIPAMFYGVILCVYLGLHCFNMLKFNPSIMEGTSINVIVELYVIVRTYVLPVMLLYMMVYIHTLEERFLKTTVYTGYFISSVIAVTNLFKISFISYASNLEKNEMIRQNIIEWFTKTPPDDLNLITSKGWFYSGNQIGLILLMLFPIVIYYALQNQTKLGYFMVFVQTAAMVMVATKTAAFGSLLVLGIMMVLEAIFCIIQRKWKVGFKNVLILGAIFCAGFFLLMKSPVIRMMGLQNLSYEKTEEQEALEKELEELVQDDSNKQEEKFDKEGFVKFLNKYYYIYGIQEEYIKLFPVEQYTEFWFDVVIDEGRRQVNFRDFKERLYRLVACENDNSGDKYWGIGYTTNFPYVEKDIVAQNIWFGNIGTVLLLGPYLLCFLYAVIKILLKFKYKFSLYNCTLGLSICAGTGGAMIAGHLFGFFFPIIIYTYILAQLLHSVLGWTIDSCTKRIEQQRN